MRSMPGRFALAALSLLCVVVFVACNCPPTSPTVRYLTVAPKSATIDAGTTQQFIATAYYSDGTQKDVSSAAVWNSSAPAIASVTGGVATGLTPGTTTISAAFSALTDTASLTVIRTLESILISPASATVALGGTQQYTAIGTYLNADGTTSTQDITTMVTWASSDTETASIGTNTGLATAVNTGVGSTNITASLDGITSNTATLTLGPAVITGIVVTPSSKTIAIGNTVALTAMEIFSNSVTQIPTAAIVWAPVCSPVGAATFVGNGSTNNYIQIATGQAAGACTVTATEGSFTASSTVTVTAGAALFAYLSGNADNTISQYSVNVASPTPLAALNPPTVFAGAPQQAFLHPNGLYAYTIAQDTTSTVHLYDIAPGTGTLTLRSGDPQVNSGAGGTNIGVIDPTGRFLYVTDETAGTVNGFTISQIDGTLTAAPGGVTGLDTPTDVLVDHQGHYLYVIDGPTVGAGAILAYSIDQTSGALTPLSTPSYPVGNQPIFATIESSDPTHPHIYVPNGGDSTVSGYTIAPATGLLTQIGAAAFPIPGATVNTFVDNAIVDPTGKFLFVIDYEIPAGNVYTFNIGAGGVIGTQVGSLVLTGDGPGGMAIDPTGKLLAIENNVDNNISLFSITGGVLTSETPQPTGSAPFGIVFYVAP